MKIIELERRTMDGKPVEYNPVYENGEDFRDWFCVIETEEEQLAHDIAIEKEGDYLVLWNEMVKHAGLGTGLSWGDDDVYGYFTCDEAVPEVGEEWVDWDSDKWVRVE